MLNLTWIKCEGDVWCSLTKLNLNMNTEGVYMIWHTGNPSRVVRLGQGDVADRLLAHRSDPKIMAYTKEGELLVTWAAVPAAQRDGVERYLANQWRPQFGDAFPNAVPIAVNAPW